MKRLLAAAALAAAVVGATPRFTEAAEAQAATPAAPAAADAKQQQKQATVPVRVVALFSSGVGYFEHIGPVTGRAETELRFKTAQINDVLKSLVVQDTAGKVNAIVYPSQDPVAKILRSFQVDITGNPSLAELLNQLRGAKVTVAIGSEQITATILGVEKKPRPAAAAHGGGDKPQVVEVAYLNLISGGTIRSIPLEDVTRLELEDPVLREELARALEALAQARDQDKKPVTIRFAGEGERLVRLGYVVETPVWKTSYRLLLDPKDAKKATLQGWAIVENQTDNDWEDVQLSLISGRPISFIQELYRPLYIPRPVVQPELFASLRPQTYEGGMSAGRELDRRADAEAAELKDADGAAASAAGGALGRAGAASAEQRLRESSARFAPAARPAAAALYDEALAKAIDPSASVESVASASKAGELFQYTVGSVSLPRQKSAMIPIVTDPVEVTKVSIYNQTVLGRHPLNGAKVRNTTGKHLLQGPITVTEANTYAGDARIDNVPPGQERLISYGIDLQVVANATRSRNENTVVGGKVVKGALLLSRKLVFSQDYAFENKAEAARTVIVEHPFRTNWKLVEPAKADETTERLYRFNVSVPAGKTETLTVREELVQQQRLEILPMDLRTMTLYARSGEVSPAVREAFAKAVALKQAMEDAQRQVNKHKQELATITQEQARIRENLKTVPDKSAYQTRLLQKLEEQEKQIDALFTKVEEATRAHEARRKELEDYVNNLNVE